MPYTHITLLEFSKIFISTTLRYYHLSSCPMAALFSTHVAIA